jgi:hypothetical protein
MAKYTLTDAYISLNAVVLSDHANSLEITYEAEDIDTTAFGVGGARDHIAGLKAWSATITFQQDHAAASVDATLFPLLGGSSFACEFRPTSGAVSATNPKYTGNAILLSYNPISGEVGEFSSVSVPLSGVGVLTRATA